MRVLTEIKHSEAMEQFIARPRFMLGASIFVAGMTLLAVEAMTLLYR